MMCRRLSLLATILAVLAYLAMPASAAKFVALTSAPVVTADIWLAPGGADSGGTTIGADCTQAAPCATPQKAADMLAANVAGDAARDYKVVMRGGRYPMTAPVTMNSTHTVASGHLTTWTAYPGETPVWEAGVDTAGTWSSTTLPNGTGAAACVSNVLAAYAPLVAGTATTQAPRYVGAFWPYGKRATGTIRPLIGQMPDRVASATNATFVNGSANITVDNVAELPAINGTLGFGTTVGTFTWYTKYYLRSVAGNVITVSTSSGGTAVTATASGSAAVVGLAVGTTVQPAETITLTNGSSTIAISDMSKVIGVPGDPLILVMTATGGFQAWRPYKILTKSAATGAGTITVASFSNSTPIVSSASATLPLAWQVGSTNAGNRVSAGSAKVNSFPTATSYATSYGDASVFISHGDASSHHEAPLYASTSSSLTAAAFSNKLSAIRSGQFFRIRNRFESLGDGAAVGEMYTNRTTGLIYYTPRAGETCAGLNAPGNAIIPGVSEELLRISSATADGSVSAATVGRMTFYGIKFQHANSTIHTRAANFGGMVGGFIGGGALPYDGLDSVINVVGSTQVTFDHVEISQTNGSALYAAQGTNHWTLNHSKIDDIGGHGVTAGLGVVVNNNYKFNKDPGYIGTGNFGPTTPYFTIGSGGTIDLTGVSDAFATLTNNKITRVGRASNSGVCVSFSAWQQSVIDGNTISECPISGIQSSSIYTKIGNLAPDYGDIFARRNYKNTVSRNIIERCGGERTVDDKWAPGANTAEDFGCYYTQNPQDGDGSGDEPTGKPLVSWGNIVRNVSGPCWPHVTWSGSMRDGMAPAILRYRDGNASNGEYSHDNVYYNSPTVDGYQVCASNVTQNTGGLRNSYSNEIISSYYPADLRSKLGDYAIRGDSPVYNLLPWRSSALTCSASAPCYVLNLGKLYSTVANGTTGATTASLPTGTGTTTDGTVTWTYVQDMAANPAIPGGGIVESEHTSITWYQVGYPSITPDNTQSQLQAGWSRSVFPEFSTNDNNMFYQNGGTIASVSSNGANVSWATWRAAGQDVNSLVDVDPNFVDPTGASGAAGFRFKATGTGTACGGTGGISPACGLGFVPYDFSAAGADW